MSPDWSWTDYGRGMAVAAARLWTDCRCGQSRTWTIRGCGCGRDSDADSARTRTRTGLGHGHGADADGFRTGHGQGHGRLTGFWRGHFVAKARPLRGRKNLILMRSKACPGYKLKNLALCCDRRERHALAAICNGTMFPACLGGRMENHALASASVASAR